MASLDWQFYAFMVTQIVIVVGAYFGLKRDNQTQANASDANYSKLAAALETSHAKLSSELTLAMLTERTTRESGHLSLKADLMDLVHAVEREVKDLTLRVSKIETGSDEWTKALRQRTHDLGTDLQKLVLKVALLEQSNGQKEEYS